MGNDGKPRPGYDRWVSFDGHGRLDDPKLNIDGAYEQKSGYITDLLNGLAIDFIEPAAQEAVLAVLRAQGGAPGRGAGGRRHAAGERLPAGRAPQGSLQGLRVSEISEHAVAARRW